MERGGRWGKEDKKHYFFRPAFVVGRLVIMYGPGNLISVTQGARDNNE
jgi:hypothetical protein